MRGNKKTSDIPECASLISLITHSFRLISLKMSQIAVGLAVGGLEGESGGMFTTVLWNSCAS